MEYIVYADESAKKGRYFSYFYGGALVRSPDSASVIHGLEEIKERVGLHGEAKWSKVTRRYLPKYCELIDAFFAFVAGDKVKVRIMFTQNLYVPQGLEPYHRKNQYALLYYQLLKHAFGLQYSIEPGETVSVRFMLDRLPLGKEESANFKAYLSHLEMSPAFRRAGIKIPIDQISEVESKKHVILQCLDVVLGSIQFRLNDKHKKKPKDSWRRGNRTIAKEKLYKRINSHIREIYPNFNIGISTGTSRKEDRWRHPYRHWLFVPSSHRYDDDPALRKNR